MPRWCPARHRQTSMLAATAAALDPTRSLAGSGRHGAAGARSPMPIVALRSSPAPTSSVASLLSPGAAGAPFVALGRGRTPPQPIRPGPRLRGAVKERASQLGRARNSPGAPSSLVELRTADTRAGPRHTTLLAQLREVGLGHCWRGVGPAVRTSHHRFPPGYPRRPRATASRKALISGSWVKTWVETRMRASSGQ